LRTLQGKFQIAVKYCKTHQHFKFFIHYTVDFGFPIFYLSIIKIKNKCQAKFRYFKPTLLQV
jgi:hypothetical protein